jgi:hypothetical protein
MQLYSNSNAVTSERIAVPKAPAALAVAYCFHPDLCFNGIVEHKLLSSWQGMYMLQVYLATHDRCMYALLLLLPWICLGCLPFDGSFR